MKFIILRSLALAGLGAFVACAAGTSVDGASALADAGASDDSGSTGDDDAAPVGDDDSSLPPPDDAGSHPKDSGGGSKKDSGGGVQDSGGGQQPDTGGGGQPDTGGGGQPDTGGGTCTLPTVIQSGNAACDSCMETSCCSQITQCLVNSAPCLSIYTCTQNCDNGSYPDGGTFDGTNQTLVDACWNTCENGQATDSLFVAEDTCVSTSCATPCMLH